MRKPYKLKGKILSSAAMASMRQTAFGMATRVQTFKVMDRSEKMRDDDAMISAAQAKRERKAKARAKRGVA